MDNVKLILVLIVLLLECIACAKGKNEDVPTCENYPSPYETVFPDQSLRKARIERCGDTLTATDQGPNFDSFEAPSMIIQLKDKHTGVPYLTTFAGQ